MEVPLLHGGGDAFDRLLLGLDEDVAAPRLRAVHPRAAELLERVGLGARLDHLPAQLSGGQKQRVAIARALSGEPPVILGDEITAALDLASGTSVMELLRGYVGPERAVLLVTHDLRMRRFADRVLHMEDGRLLGEAQEKEGTP